MSTISTFTHLQTFFEQSPNIARLYSATGLLLVKFYVNKMVKSPINCVMFVDSASEPQVANQKKQDFLEQRFCVQPVIQLKFENL